MFELLTHRIDCEAIGQPLDGNKKDINLSIDVFSAVGMVRISLCLYASKAFSTAPLSGETTSRTVFPLCFSTADSSLGISAGR